MSLIYISIYNIFVTCAKTKFSFSILLVYEARRIASIKLLIAQQKEKYLQSWNATDMFRTQRKQSSSDVIISMPTICAKGEKWTSCSNNFPLQGVFSYSQNIILVLSKYYICELQRNNINIKFKIQIYTLKLYN